jgi:hypothetical protein
MKRKTLKDTSGPQSGLAQKIQAYLTERELGKAHYMRADEVLEAIVKIAPLDQAIPLSETESAEVVDLFKESLKVFRAHGISRYEIKVKKTVKCKNEKPAGPPSAKRATTMPANEKAETTHVS